MLKTSPLDAAHRALGAKMGAFGGWDMPISYAGTIAEHTAVRERAGLFDVSHLGKVLVTGAQARAFLDSQLTNRMAELGAGRARYTLLFNDDGGIVDDLIVYALSADELLVVPNASNRDCVAAILSGAAPVGVSSAIVDWTTLAVQGPASAELIGALYPWAKDLGYMRVAREGSVVVSRSGYTGEHGYEVFTPFADAMPVWDALLAAVRTVGGEPCGLAARDTLRLEMGYPLHGNDIDAGTTAAEAGLMWAVALEGREFPGARALRERAPRKTLIGVRMQDRVIPRAHCAVLLGDRTIGECTSGTFSPTLKQGIALAYVAPGSVTGGDEVAIEVRGKRGAGVVVRPPFVDRTPK